MPSRTDRRDRLFRIAESQEGYFTAAQARDAGYSRASQHYHQKAGNWSRVGHGIYRLNRFPQTAAEQYVVLMLWSRNRAGEIQAAISHGTALQAYELSDIMPAAIDLSVPKGFRKQPPAGVRLHRQPLSSNDVLDRDGYRITTPLRTLLDVAASSISPEHLEKGVEDALQLGLVSSSILRAEVEKAPAKVKERFGQVGFA